MITTGNWPDALEPIVRKNHDMGFEEPPFEKEAIWSVRKGKKRTETYMEIGDIPQMGTFTGSVNYADVSEGYTRTATATQFAQGIKIERQFVETDQQDVVDDLPKKLGISARRRMGTDVYNYFNNSFNTSVVTIDNLQLCSSAHTSNNGGSSQSNRGTSAFSALSVEATAINMIDFLSNTDGVIDVNPDTLIVPKNLREAAWEIINSDGKADTANNNRNFLKGKYNVIVGGVWMTDTNNWFMVDSKMMKMYFDWFDIVPLEFNQAKDFDGFTAKYADYMFYGNFVRDWRPIFGHEVS